ncbi:hypothetical protein VKT23_012252 [Stygiomarasmius scandens]|uniref:Deacetylase sirtuin-type domain-containing protein n=1 Tax=Marasmiellus scandens TaxID=2682957 RepID=A0ABR1JB09_9AGAR
MPYTSFPTIALPNLEATFSVFPDKGLNPSYSEIRPQSRAWAAQYEQIIGGTKCCTYMDKCNFQLLASLGHPCADEIALRGAMDMLNMVFIYDEYTDKLSGPEAERPPVIIQRTLTDPNFDDNSWLCRMTREFHDNVLQKAGPEVRRRFIQHYCDYAIEVHTEAVLRDKNEVLDFSSYLSFRRETSGVRYTFDTVEYCLGLDLPQYVHDDPVFVTASNAGMDLIFWTNDLYSYDMEQSKGDHHDCANIITVIMKSKGIDAQAAVHFVAGYIESLTAQFLTAKQSLSRRSDPIFSEHAVRLLDGLGDWVRGHNQWYFASERYFGKEGIPTFRGSGGMWRSLDATSLATPTAFQSDPSLVWQFYHHRRVKALEASPNAGHRALAKLAVRKFLEKVAPAAKTYHVITQNVDRLSVRALHELSETTSTSSSKADKPKLDSIIEMHGKLFDVKCSECTYCAEDLPNPLCPSLGAAEEQFKDFNDAGSKSVDIPVSELPRCPQCGALARPGVVWFEEKPYHLDEINSLVYEADFCLVVGTSSTVRPASTYAFRVQRHGGTVAVFNVEPIESSYKPDFFFQGPCEVELPRVLGIEA